MVRGYEYDVVKELGDEAALKMVVDGLEKGKLANPQYKAVDLYGMDGKKLFVENERKVGGGLGTADGWQPAGGMAAPKAGEKADNETKQGRRRG